MIAPVCLHNKITFYFLNILHGEVGYHGYIIGYHSYISQSRMAIIIDSLVASQNGGKYNIKRVFSKLIRELCSCYLPTILFGMVKKEMTLKRAQQTAIGGKYI